MAAIGTTPQKIDLAAAGEPSSAARVGDGIPAAIAGTGAPPAARSIRRTGRPSCVAAPWTKIAEPPPAAGGAPMGERSQTARPPARARGSPQASVDIARRLI